MYAQVFELPGVERSTRLDRAIQRELLPAIRGEHGFCGALALMRRETSDMLLLVFWETEHQAASTLVPSVVAFVDETGALDSSGRSPQLWEVVARA